MNRLSVALLAGLLMLSLLPSVSAQSADAPHLSPDHPILYAHHDESDTEELHGWMNTLPADGNDIALGPPLGTPPVFTGPRTNTFTLSPGLQSGVELDPDGTIEIIAHVGAGSGNGFVFISTRLLHGGEVVAEGEETEHAFTEAGTGPYPEVTWSLSPLITTLEPGVDLVWELTYEGLASAIFVSVSEERGSSRVELPVLSGGEVAPAGPVLDILADEFAPDHAYLSVQADNATSGPLNRTWESGLANATVTFTGNVTNGTVAVALRDNATTLAELNLTGEVNQTVEITGAMVGNWTLDLVFTDFQGNITVSIGPASEGPVTGDDGDGSDDLDENDQEHEDEEESSRWIPSPGLGALLVGLGAIAALRRRS